MQTRRKRSALDLRSAIEALEGRVVLSTMTPGNPMPQGVVAVATHLAKVAATQTSMTVTTGTLNQPVSINVSVHASGSAGSPTGTVNIVDHGQVVDSITLAAGTKAGTSTAGSTLVPQPGGGAYYFGKHQLTAVFVPTGAFARSSVVKSFAVALPSYATLPGGVKVATVAAGSGAQVESGQTAHVLYTGYLAKTGQIFDDSAHNGGTPLGFTLGTGQVVPGFDAGTVGMQPGETRIIQIPPAQGYGAKANGPIPGNSTLIFVVTLQSIS